VTTIELVITEAKREADESIQSAAAKETASVMYHNATERRTAQAVWWTDAFLRAVRRQGYDVAPDEAAA
jgi:hypothetical protein